MGGNDAKNIANGVTIYDLGDQPFARATIGDVWLLGVRRDNAVQPTRPRFPTGILGDRGKAYAMPDSGNYILRSDNSSNATQITFDAGPKGGFHGHNDLLNFELWSGGRPLIVDPGPYLYPASADRDYVVSTKAHNTDQRRRPEHRRRRGRGPARDRRELQLRLGERDAPRHS